MGVQCSLYIGSVLLLLLVCNMTVLHCITTDNVNFNLKTNAGSCSHPRSGQNTRFLAILKNSLQYY